MPGISRRGFLKTACASAASAAFWKSASPLMADPLGLPLGLQLYSVRELLPKDFEGTLRQLAAIGFHDVEAAGFYGHSAGDVKQIMDRVGLHCVSAHYPMAQLQSNLEEIIRFGKELGLEYIVCSSPMLRDSSNSHSFRSAMEAMTLDDWRWNAEQFNPIAERVHAEGIQFGYHNHFTEFRRQNGVLPYDELLRLTDPVKVTMEMDCGWVIVGGQSPVDYLTRHPKRFSMLHVKDFKLGAKESESQLPPPTALGKGSIDYGPIFKAAKKAGIRHYFVEQEQFDMAPMEELKVDADYVHNLKV
jgi:sugar phosphate isomerase/epimerase